MGLVSHDLERFVAAQDSGGTYEQALAELRAGHKTSHWMWFVFPQITGLGQSEMSRRYAIASLEEAREYLAHPVLGPRLIECSEALLTHEGKSAAEILGGIDATKLRSSMTLFTRAAASNPSQTPHLGDSDRFGVFRRVLERYFEGEPDPETERRL